MRNILDEKPNTELTGRLLASARFVDDEDLRGKAVLDIGCGLGWCELNFLDRGVRRIVGVEVSEGDLSTIRENIISDRLSLGVAGATHLPFVSRSFDTIVSWEVLEHIPRGDEAEMFCEVARLLRPNGVFYMSTPHRSLFSNIMDPAWWAIGHRHYSRQSLEGYAGTASMTWEVCKIKGKWWTGLSALNMYISKWLLGRPRILESLFAAREDAEHTSDGGFVSLFGKFRKLA